jgi:hypothetical protein
LTPLNQIAQEILTSVIYSYSHPRDKPLTATVAQSMDLNMKIQSSVMMKSPLKALTKESLPEKKK